MQDLKEDPPDADCLIVGSDQVWNLNTNPEFVPARFLDFGAEELLRFSYAASIERMDYTEDQRNTFAKNWQGLKESLFERNRPDYILSHLQGTIARGSWIGLSVDQIRLV